MSLVALGGRSHEVLWKGNYNKVSSLRTYRENSNNREKEKGKERKGKEKGQEKEKRKEKGRRWLAKKEMKRAGK